ncbi:hypothetical protein [Providencia alcalifaciens]|uniref:hypothetical protein n=1 Tax=Providencia alcalifaciens TaxID=126385 RepID=UPI003D98F4EE
MDKSRQQFEEWRSKNKSSTINLFDVWQASRENLINSLEPVGYIGAISLLRIRRNEKSYIYPDNNIKTIPLYRLDK